MPSDDPFFTVTGSSIQGSYIPVGSSGSTIDTSNPSSLTSVTSGGITFNLIFDAAAMAAPPSFRAGIQQAVAILAANITDQITVNIKIDYSGTGGGAAAGPDSGLYENYSWVRSNLLSHASPADMTFNELPNASSIQGQASVAVWNTQLKLWGVLGANDLTTDDGSATFATDINPNLLVGVALHELTHAIGRVPYGSAPDIFDLFRFTSSGARLFQGGATAPAAYFSLDGGASKLADYGQTSDPSDFLNSGVQGANDPFNEFYTSSTIQGLTASDLKQLDALGFHLALNNPVTIESYGTTALVKIGMGYYLGNSGPLLKYNGTAVSTAQFSPWAPIGAEQTGSGFDFAWKVPGADAYTVWATDAAGNYAGNLTPIVSGKDATLENLETVFHQDLNGDGTLGYPVIEGIGATALLQAGSNYELGISGPLLKYAGATVTIGQFGAWTPIGAEQTAGSFDVALKVPGADAYTVWATDATGNYTGNLTPMVSGKDTMLENLETVFHQDLNGDGTVGFPAIEAIGATTLLQAGNNYELGNSGPLLKYAGATVTIGQFGAWTPIGAEQTASGFDVAFKVPGTDNYTVWSTDSNGNYTGNLTEIVSGHDATLESLETVFHQDINGDGTVGFPAIEAIGATAFLQAGNNYELGNSGPLLKYAGATVTIGQFGAWTPIGAEQTASGFDVALKVPGADAYTVWATDATGNYTGNLTPMVSGRSAALESLEITVFHQDLNGDGTIGYPVIESRGSTNLLQVGSNFELGDSGPLLKYDGTAVVSGQFGAWTPIGAEQTASGFDFAWKTSGADNFTMWSTDSSGNYTGNVLGVVSGSSTALQSLESVFSQDLNGDGHIGLSATSPAVSTPVAAAAVTHVDLAQSAPALHELDHHLSGFFFTS
ncbi:NF038122 family metalloprotease [Bradyrhizobium sp. CCBAU 45384]|uniref:NF038122 family metalloprotease n=1 Tax=Bradyrhizobium sp. CCBAU 45384 TaxID=858428 RepID=UPI002304DA39|nr:NF038122 family metalloprotease [Bradyrhizobium sp. CCBAU 45384]